MDENEKTEINENGMSGDDADMTENDIETAQSTETGLNDVQPQVEVQEDRDAAGAVQLWIEDAEPEEEKKERKPLPFCLGILVGAALMLVVAMAAMFITTNLLINKSKSSQESETADVDIYDSSTYSSKIDTILTYLKRYYLYDTDQESIEEGIADGIMSATGDKYAVYYTPEEFQDLIESTSGSYAGIGVSIIMNDDNQVEVYKVFSDSPAAEADIHVGDLIVEADGVTEFAELDDLVAVVRGEIGTTVDIVIERDGEKIPLTVERATIKEDTIAYQMLDNNIGYIYISEFDTVTVEQFNEAIDDLTQQGMTSVIFDLRDNPGGDYDAVVAMADRVLPEGVIMTVKDVNGVVKTEKSDAENCVDLPMAVIINGNSASAAEVFTGAIQDYGIATIVGEQSYGKGIVQSIFQLPDGSGIKFTTEEYFTPSGDSIHGEGITPDVVVSLPDDVYDDGVFDIDEDTQLQAAIDALTK